MEKRLLRIIYRRKKFQKNFLRKLSLKLRLRGFYYVFNLKHMQAIGFSLGQGLLFICIIA